MRQTLGIGTLALLTAAITATAASAATPGAWTLNAISQATRNALAEYQLKDVIRISGTLPEIVVERGAGGLIVANGRQILDLRVINVMLVNRGRHPPVRHGSTTGEAIDAWTGAVQYGRPTPYGSSVDQWVAMVYYLGPL